MKILFAVASYLVGSIPTAYLLVRVADRSDIRRTGSGNMGATNVLRTKGLGLAVPVIVIDVLKGFLPAFLGLRFFHDPALAALAAFLAVLGHCFPFSIGFKGGKGMATSMGAFAALSPAAFAAALALFVVVVAATRRVSLGSILAAAAVPFFSLAFRAPRAVFFGGLAIGALVIFMHRANIVRLLKGTERRLGDKIP